MAESTATDAVNDDEMADEALDERQGGKACGFLCVSCRVDRS